MEKQDIYDLMLELDNKRFRLRNAAHVPALLRSVAADIGNFARRNTTVTDTYDEVKLDTHVLGISGC